MIKDKWQVEFSHDKIKWYGYGVSKPGAEPHVFPSLEEAEHVYHYIRAHYQGLCKWVRVTKNGEEFMVDKVDMRDIIPGVPNTRRDAVEEEEPPKIPDWTVVINFSTGSIVIEPKYTTGKVEFMDKESLNLLIRCLNRASEGLGWEEKITYRVMEENAE